MKQLLRGGEAAFYCLACVASFLACVGSKKEQKQKSAGVLYDELRHFLCVVYIYLSDYLFGCKEQ